MRLDWLAPGELERRQIRIGGTRDDELQACRRCSLWRHANAVVPGEGPAKAPLMVVGELPGPEEERSGKPFSGPAGALLELLMRRTGLDRAQTWMTHVVKHWKRDPAASPARPRRARVIEIEACRVWLDEEIRQVSPRVILLAGAQAVRALLGPGATIESARKAGPIRRFGAMLVTTYHPCALLREPNQEQREWMRQQVESDLRVAAGLLGQA